MMSDTPKLAATREAEEKIRVILQEYHNSTGMIPESIGFHNVDVSTVNDDRTRIAVSNVHLKATT